MSCDRESEAETETESGCLQCETGILISNNEMGTEMENNVNFDGNDNDDEEFRIRRKSPTEKARLSTERRKQIDIYKESVTREEREMRYKRRLNGDPVSSPAKDTVSGGDSGGEGSPRKLKRVAFKAQKGKSIGR